MENLCLINNSKMLLFLQISDVIEKNFTDLHNKITEKSNSLADVKQRALNLIASSKTLYLNALKKISDVEGK